MSYQKLYPFMDFSLVDPDSLLFAHHVPMLVIWLEQLSKFGWPAFDNLRRYLFEVSSWSTWPQVKLVDVYDPEFILVNQIQRALELFVSFLSKPANDISSNSDPRTVFQKVVTNFSEILNWILTIHFCQHVIVSSLHWDVNESKDSWVVQKMCDSP